MSEKKPNPFLFMLYLVQVKIFCRTTLLRVAVTAGRTNYQALIVNELVFKGYCN